MREPHISKVFPGPRASRIIELQERLLSPSSTRDYPIVVDSGQGCWITDVDGNEFLDFSAGIAVCTTGHSHPRIVAAISRQSERLIHMSGTDFYYESQGELARVLNDRVFPGSPARVFFTNSGTETIEAAIKLARYSTKRTHLIAFEGAFHGRSLGALSLTNSKLVQRKGFGPLLPEVSHVPYPGRDGIDVDRTLSDLATIFRRRVDPQEVAGIVVEPIQGEGGYIVPPPEFLSALRTLCDRHGMLLIVDEIQSGMGRTGKFCAFQHDQIIPDIVCLAKGIASGLPLGALVSRSELMTWPPGSHGSTFGGNPVACEAALTTIALLDEGLMRNATTMGELLRLMLDELAHQNANIKTIRGRGLMMAIDLPDSQWRKLFLNRCLQRGLILLGAGERSVRLCPPLIVSAEEVQLAAQIIGTVAAEISPEHSE